MASMGRPGLAPGGHKKVRLDVYMRPEHRDVIESRARALGLTMSAYLVMRGLQGDGEPARGGGDGD